MLVCPVSFIKNLWTGFSPLMLLIDHEATQPIADGSKNIDRTTIEYIR